MLLSLSTPKTSMSLDNVTPGKKAPHEFNVIIEIPMNADPIKYEVDKEPARSSSTAS
jgi:inorganic pyrophosphatase